MPELIPVHSQKQIAEVVRLAREIWEEHYVPIIGRGQVDYMLEKFQSAEAISKQIIQGTEYYLACHDGGLAGYTAVIPDTGKSALMISKIYVHQAFRGHGVGRAMLEFIEKRGCQYRFRTLWLTVNKNNNRSIDWYLRMGFVNTESIQQDIGGGFIMDDFRMEKVIVPNAIPYLRAKITRVLINYFGNDDRRIEHALRVLHHADQLIDNFPGCNTDIVIASALLHDVGIKISEEKHGYNNGKTQEEYGPDAAGNLLESIGYPPGKTEIVKNIIGNHHSPSRYNYPELALLKEADRIANQAEEA